MLVLRGYVDLPPGRATAFDHGDVDGSSGRVYIAHTAENTVEVVDGERMTYIAGIPGCREGSGVLCAQLEGLVFAAARGAGLVLVIDAVSNQVSRIATVGPRPNGLAWDPGNKHLLVADVQENTALLLDLSADPLSRILSTPLPGRPRWCVFDAARQRYLVNIREPASVVVLEAATGQLVAQWPLSHSGPHGLDTDAAGRRAFIACDAGQVVALDLATGEELGSVPIAGPPDATWYNPRRALLYVAIGEVNARAPQAQGAQEARGVLEVIDTRTMTVRQQVPTEQGAGTTAYDGQRQRLYIFLPQTCRVAVYDEA